MEYNNNNLLGKNVTVLFLDERLPINGEVTLIDGPFIFLKDSLIDNFTHVIHIELINEIKEKVN